MYTSYKFISCKKLLYYVRLFPHRRPHFSSPRPLRSRPCPSWFHPHRFFFPPALVQIPPHALFNSVRAHYDTTYARLYSVRACSVFFRARFVYVRTYCTDVRARRTHVSVWETLVRARGLRIRARRSTVRALEHLIRADINAFAPEGSRETTAACAWGTISLRPFIVHSVQSPYAWACNYACSFLLGTLWVRTKANFI
jgi:hypothetical protein